MKKLLIVSFVALSTGLMAQNVGIVSVHALSHQACPYVHGIARLAPPCAQHLVTLKAKP